ncbi:MAG: pantoate--beta-alanine ligase [Maribacter sp.]|jgi:pantoate--beta-alanine ligase
MRTYKTVRHLRNYLEKQRKAGKSIGFTPTMGALHDGHIFLIKKSNEQCDITICSIFVNPTQFGVAADLEKYPRTLEKDSNMLKAADCDVVFIPSVHEMYPPNLDTNLDINFGQLENVMEGEHRIGHFAGVAQVLNRFLNIIEADAMYMGQKDYQQFSVVRELLRQLKSKTALVMGKTVRETDGLAMSSRNLRLNEKERSIAPLISKTLFAAKEKIGKKSIATIKKEALEALDIPEFGVEYFEIADGITLQPISSIEGLETAVACTAVHLGPVRLIDNVVLL